jgi:hypothetical protein
MPSGEVGGRLPAVGSGEGCRTGTQAVQERNHEGPGKPETVARENAGGLEGALETLRIGASAGNRDASGAMSLNLEARRGCEEIARLPVEAGARAVDVAATSAPIELLPEDPEPELRAFGAQVRRLGQPEA